MSSILDDIKHQLNIVPEDTTWDRDIINYINGAFGDLHRIGVGPAVGFQITNKDNQWDEFYTDARLNGVRTFIYLTVKQSHDPPPTGFATEAMDRQIQKLEYSLNIVADYG